MTRRLQVRTERWPLARPFTISRDTKEAVQLVVAEIADGGWTGRGECVPYARYGETAAAVEAAVRAQVDRVAAGMSRTELAAALPAGAARNALDCALWDLEAKRAGVRAWDLAGLSAPRPVVTAETLSLDTPAAMGRAAAALADRPLLKLKLDARDIEARVVAVRAAAPRARLIVDANEAWTPDITAAVDPVLARLGVALIEQPLPAGNDGALAHLRTAVPLCADESCHTTDDLLRLRGRYGYVNIKLDKTGGLSEALRLAAAAREAGFGIMAGCMVSTSLAMAPAFLLAPLADYVDLDGPIWLADDRPCGLRFRGGRVEPPEPALWG